MDQEVSMSSIKGVKVGIAVRNTINWKRCEFMPLGICDFDPEFLNNPPKLKCDNERWPMSMICCINAILFQTKSKCHRNCH